MDMTAKDTWLQLLHLSAKQRAQIFEVIRKEEITYLSEHLFYKRFIKNNKHFFTKAEQYLDNETDTLFFYDDNYPELLREIHEAPPLLFIKGNKKLLTKKNIAVVGTRNMSTYGKEVTTRLTGELVKKGFVITSGLAYGIDETAHRAVLMNRGKTIAVLGGGISKIYPSKNQKLAEKISQTGLLVSEYTPKTAVQKWFFPERNRLISGLARGTVIVEAKTRSGSLITANFSLEQGREVFAVPGSIFSDYSKGTNRLIQEGAKLVMDVEDIIEECR